MDFNPKIVQKMKKIFVVFIFFALLETGCKKYFDVNTSPNDPKEVSVDFMLPAVQVSMYQDQNGHLARLTSMLLHQSAGTDRQYQSYDLTYTITESEIDNEWNNMFGSTLMNATQLIKKADETGNPWYAGIGRVIKAMELGTATDLWGDIPNSEAFKGTDNLSPKYDSQQQVYNDIQKLLDDAIANFNMPANQNVIMPGSNDLIFGGDITNWKICAYILKARFANNLSKKNPSGSATEALQYVQEAENLGASNDANMYAVYGADATNNNLWFQFLTVRDGYISMGQYFIDTLKALNDPRLPLYAETNDAGNYVGADPGGQTIDPDGWSIINTTTFAGPDSKLPLVTYAELLFIKAEANKRLGNEAAASAAYDQAITASMEQFGVSATDIANYLAANGSNGNPVSLDQIMLQKYIAMFTQIQAYTDWRRTNFPTLAPSGTNTQIPRRLPTAQSERIFNTNATVNQNIFDRVWWDQ